MISQLQDLQTIITAGPYTKIQFFLMWKETDMIARYIVSKGGGP